MLVFVKGHFHTDAHELGAACGYRAVKIGKGQLIGIVGIKPFKTNVFAAWRKLSAVVEHKGKAVLLVGIYIAVGIPLVP